MENVGRLAAVPWQRKETGPDDTRERRARRTHNFRYARLRQRRRPQRRRHFPIVARAALSVKLLLSALSRTAAAVGSGALPLGKAGLS